MRVRGAEAVKVSIHDKDLGMDFQLVVEDRFLPDF